MRLVLPSLILAPVVLLPRFLEIDGETGVFLTSAAVLIPLAGLPGPATEEPARNAGSHIGVLLNATLGHAAELIEAALIAALIGGRRVKSGRRGAIVALYLMPGISFTFEGRGVAHGR